MEFVKIAMAQAKGTPAQQPNVVGLLLPFILMFLVIYIFLVLPQKKQQKKLEEMRNSLKNGDKVILSSGFIGTIKEIKKDKNEVKIDLGNNTIVTVLKSSILEKINK